MILYLFIFIVCCSTSPGSDPCCVCPRVCQPAPLLYINICNLISFYLFIYILSRQVAIHVAFVHAFVNPLLFLVLHPELRGTVMDILCCRWNIFFFQFLSIMNCLMSQLGPIQLLSCSGPKRCVLKSAPWNLTQFAQIEKTRGVKPVPFITLADREGQVSSILGAL